MFQNVVKCTDGFDSIRHVHYIKFCCSAFERWNQDAQIEEILRGMKYEEQARVKRQEEQLKDIFHLSK
jgi:hypothetical protein